MGWIEKNEAVRMSCCMLHGKVGGWVIERERKEELEIEGGWM